MAFYMDYNINGGFQYKNGDLYCEGVRVTDIPGNLSQMTGVELNTPVFVFSKQGIIYNVTRYVEALDEIKHKYILNYSMKANPNPTILRILKERHVSLTLVSGMELRFALECGFDPLCLVFNGNGKLDAEIELAINHGVLLNVDSTFNMRQIMRKSLEMGRQVKVLLRINPGVDPNVHKYVSTGQHGSKFGLFNEELQEVLTLANSCTSVTVVGLHCHLGSTIKRTDVIRASISALTELWADMKSMGFKHMQYLNIGGGLDIPYEKHINRTKPFRCLSERLKTMVTEMMKDTMDEPSRKLLDDFIEERITVEEVTSKIMKDHSSKRKLTELMQNIMKDGTLDQHSIPSVEDLVKSFADLLDDDMVLIIEPGRSLIGDTAVLYSTVLGHKKSDTKRYLVIDGSMTEVIRPCLYEAYHHIDLACHSEHQEKYVFDVVGPVCESADFLGKERLLTVPRDGCGVIVFDVGAYCGSMSSNYNLRVRPAEVLVDGNRISIIRNQETFSDLMRQYLV